MAGQQISGQAQAGEEIGVRAVLFETRRVLGRMAVCRRSAGRLLLAGFAGRLLHGLLQHFLDLFFGHGFGFSRTHELSFPGWVDLENR